MKNKKIKKVIIFLIMMISLFMVFIMQASQNITNSKNQNLKNQTNLYIKTDKNNKIFDLYNLKMDKNALKNVTSKYKLNTEFRKVKSDLTKEILKQTVTQINANLS